MKTAATFSFSVRSCVDVVSTAADRKPQNFNLDLIGVCFFFFLIRHHSRIYTSSNYPSVTLFRFAGSGGILTRRLLLLLPVRPSSAVRAAPNPRLPSSSSQLLAQLARLPFPGLERGFGVQQLVQLPADADHVQLGGLALLPQGGRLHPQLRGGDGELLAALAALNLHPAGVAQQRLHAHCHRFPLILRHVLDRGQRSCELDRDFDGAA